MLCGPRAVTQDWVAVTGHTCGRSNDVNLWPLKTHAYTLYVEFWIILKGVECSNCERPRQRLKSRSFLKVLITSFRIETRFWIYLGQLRCFWMFGECPDLSVLLYKWAARRLKLSLQYRRLGAWCKFTISTAVCLLEVYSDTVCIPQVWYISLFDRLKWIVFYAKSVLHENAEINPEDFSPRTVILECKDGRRRINKRTQHPTFESLQHLS